MLPGRVPSDRRETGDGELLHEPERLGHAPCLVEVDGTPEAEPDERGADREQDLGAGAATGMEASHGRRDHDADLHRHTEREKAVVHEPIRKTGWSGAMRAKSSGGESGPTPSKNWPTSHFQRRR